MKLVRGVGSPDEGACWMSAINWYMYSDRSGFTWSDHPSCVDPVIRTLAISLNDQCTGEEREKLIGPHIFLPIGTNVSKDLTVKRAYKCADWAIRVLVVRALRNAGLDVQAGRLEGLPEISDKITAHAADAACAKAYYAAAKAAYAAYGAKAACAAACAAAFAADAVKAAHTADPANEAAFAAYATNTELLQFIIELCEMGSAEQKPCRTKEEVLGRLKTGNFA